MYYHSYSIAHCACGEEIQATCIRHLACELLLFPFLHDVSRYRMQRVWIDRCYQAGFLLTASMLMAKFLKHPFCRHGITLGTPNCLHSRHSLSVFSKRSTAAIHTLSFIMMASLQGNKEGLGHQQAMQHTCRPGTPSPGRAWSLQGPQIGRLW